MLDEISAGRTLRDWIGILKKELEDKDWNKEVKEQLELFKENPSVELWGKAAIMILNHKPVDREGGAWSEHQAIDNATNNIGIIIERMRDKEAR